MGSVGSVQCVVRLWGPWGLCNVWGGYGVRAVPPVCGEAMGSVESVQCVVRLWGPCGPSSVWGGYGVRGVCAMCGEAMESVRSLQCVGRQLVLGALEVMNVASCSLATIVW